MAAHVQMQPQYQVPNAVPGGSVPPMVVSLYVGDLDPNVTDPQLFEHFSQIGEVISVRICRDATTQRSLGYGYVNFKNAQDAERCLMELNFTPLNEKPIRIMYSHRDPSGRRSGAGNIFIKNLDKEIDHKALHETFSSFGNILSCKVATDSSGQSLGYGFVQYINEEAAQKAIEQLNGMLLNGKQVFVGPFLRKQERNLSADKTKFTNVFVKNLSDSTTEVELRKIFGDFGPMTSAVVMKNDDGTSRCFGFINFENPDDASRAVESLNGKKFDDKEWYVGRAQKKSEREQELKNRFQQIQNEAAEKSQASNLYVKNLDDTIDDEKLKELFSPFGTITSCKVVRDTKGISRGSGFVAFSSPQEASRALFDMNGRMIISKPLYVALAQKKEDRRARLQAQFFQMRPMPLSPNMAPRMPMFSTTHGLGQQIFYGQPPPNILPPQAGFGYQQQLVPGVRPSGPLMPNMFAPMVQQAQQGPRGGRRANGAGPLHLGPQMMQQQQQITPRGRGFRHPSRPDTSFQGNMPGGVISSLPYDMNGLAMRDIGIPQQVPTIGALASALANASPSEQRMMLGENLYPLVEQLEPDMSAKVTGMLLEMDQTEVLHLLESPEALKAKVAEAMDVLRNVSQQQGIPADQLAALSLNE